MIRNLLIFLVKGYQKLLSPILPDSCRFYPTCSSYMIDALILGLVMGCARILSCNPFNRGGVDPVPDNFTLFRNPHPEHYEDEIIVKKFHSDAN